MDCSTSGVKNERSASRAADYGLLGAPPAFGLPPVAPRPAAPPVRPPAPPPRKFDCRRWVSVWTDFNLPFSTRRTIPVKAPRVIQLLRRPSRDGRYLTSAGS